MKQNNYLSNSGLILLFFTALRNVWAMVKLRPIDGDAEELHQVFANRLNYTQCALEEGGRSLVGKKRRTGNHSLSAG